MADQTHTQTNPNAPTSGHDKSKPTSQGGQPNEMPDRGKTDGQPADRQPEQVGGSEAMKNEGGGQSSSTMQNKGMGEDEKASAERTTSDSQSR